MSAPPRPVLKLSFGKKKSHDASASGASPPTESQPPSSSTEPPQRKLTLKIGGRKPSIADEGETQGGGGGAALSKKKPSKKRPAEGPPTTATTTKLEATVSKSQPGPKRLKLIPSKKPGVQSIRIKNKGLVPNRPVGVGYDSEASDTEIDPSIEEQFILRMLPGDDCEYLRQAINERRFDRSEFAFKPLTREGRRAIFKVRDRQYAAALVDLPCIIEGMKSWDRRGWYKSGDICQMLLVLGPVTSEKEAMEYPLPPEVEAPDEKTLQYPHGLTPPLRWVKKRRFRERVSTRTIEQVERAVADLIAQDNEAIGPPRYELVDSAALNRAEGLVQSGNYGEEEEEEEEEYDDEQDAEGEADEYMQDATAMEDDFEDALAAEMEAALAAGVDDEALAPTADAGQPPPLPSLSEAGTPAAAAAAAGKVSSTPAADTSGDESESDADEEDEEEAEEELDEEQLERQRQMQQQREEIAELEALIRAETVKWETMGNQILKGKLGKRIQSLKQDLALKKVSVGEGDGDT